MNGKHQSPELRHVLRACRGYFVTAALFSLGINILYLAAPLYMLQVYDRVVSSGSVTTLVMLTVALLATFIALAGLDVVRGGGLSAPANLSPVGGVPLRHVHARIAEINRIEAFDLDRFYNLGHTLFTTTGGAAEPMGTPFLPKPHQRPVQLSRNRSQTTSGGARLRTVKQHLNRNVGK